MSNNIRLLAADAGDHIVIRSYFGLGSLHDVVEACINATVAAGKPGMFRDELGAETWFHQESVAVERTAYMRKQRAAQIAVMPIWVRVLRLIKR